MYMYDGDTRTAHLKPTAVTEEVGLSEPVKVSLMTSGGCLARLNMVARTAGAEQHQRNFVVSHILQVLYCIYSAEVGGFLHRTIYYRWTIFKYKHTALSHSLSIDTLNDGLLCTDVVDEAGESKDELQANYDVEEVHWVERVVHHLGLVDTVEVEQRDQQQHRSIGYRRDHTVST